MIVGAQAFHWFDREACKKEFGRILKPGGRAVLVWNNRKVLDSGFSAIIREPAQPDLPVYLNKSVKVIQIF